MKTLIIIPSRMSATRLPGKPLLKINGLSIISHVSKKAEEADIGEVIVATEDQEIVDDVKKNGSNAILTSTNLTLGLRIPNSHIAQSLMLSTGPLLTSSANISGFKGSITSQSIAIDFPSVSVLGPIPWEKSSGKASTIISWKKSGNWRLIREGEVFVKELY